MGLGVGVLKEVLPGERRVAIVPAVVETLRKLGAGVIVERGAGLEAGFPDADYLDKGARLVDSAEKVGESAQILMQVRVTATRPVGPEHTLIGFCDPLNSPQLAAEIAREGITLFSMELIPRITRAQSMDALSSMATIAGYKAVLLSAEILPRMFPLLMTAAGTIPPARVLVIGAGVAGLQAIATARRLGAVVSGYDIRSAVKEQIESLGAKFIDIQLAIAGEGEGGYARALGEEDYRSIREQLTPVLREQDVVITTAAVPGKASPVLISESAVRSMKPGAVIVDLAAERGGNCELTQTGRSVTVNGVAVLGPVNLPSTVPTHASLMYARNLFAFFKHLVKDGSLNIDIGDEITRESLVARGGSVVHPKVQALLGRTVHV